MKNFTLAIIVFFVIQITVIAQSIEITPQFGYQMNGKAYFYQGDITVQDAASYGITIGIPVDWNTFAEFSYSRSDATASFFARHPDYNDDKFDIASNYFLLSGNKQGGNEKVAGFGGVALGAAWFDAKSTGINDVWRFAASLQAGAKLYLSDRIGIRLQGRLLLPMYFAGGGLYCGVGGGGSGCGVGVSSTSTIVQGDISGGLILQLGDYY